MGMMKALHHDEIARRFRPLGHKPFNHAEDEHYAEQRRCQELKRKMTEKKEAPIAPPHPTPHYAGRRLYMADPATDAARFEKVCREADAEAKKTGDNIVVFRNEENQYFTWEEKYISSANPVVALYTALAPAKEEKC